MTKDTLKEELSKAIKEKIKESLGVHAKPAAAPAKVAKPAPVKPVVTEALVATPRAFVLKTEKLSKRTKEGHETLYKKHVDSFNKISSELDAANKHEADSYVSMYRALKMDECDNLNSIKLHELYFNNISDLASEISVDSIPFIKLSRDFGTFEDWQFDFLACCLSSREGWAMTVYEPYKGVYMNVCADGNAAGIPVGCIPVLVIDMWSHSYFKDYDIDKKSYAVAMMKEINWDVVEARMALADKSDMAALYHIKPTYNDNAEKMLDAAADTNAPVQNVVDNGVTVPPTSPAGPLNGYER